MEVFLLHGGGLALGQTGRPALLEALGEVPERLKRVQDVPWPDHLRPWQRPGWLAEVQGWLQNAVGNGRLLAQVSSNDLGCVML